MDYHISPGMHVKLSLTLWPFGPVGTNANFGSLAVTLANVTLRLFQVVITLIRMIVVNSEFGEQH